MASTQPTPLVVVDIGNSRIKFGLFVAPWATPLPEPTRTLAVDHDWKPEQLLKFLDATDSMPWRIASVNRPAASRLQDWLTNHGANSVQMLAHTDLPLEVRLDQPARVGIDRLASALAANRLRAAGSPAIVVGCGSAITVDLVSAEGAFLGGAILSGIHMAARALHEFTDLLPLVDVDDPPAAMGRSTSDAIASGLYWGAVGAVREVVARLSTEYPQPDVFVTGGAAPSLIATLSESIPRLKFVSNLTLAGIALAR